MRELNPNYYAVVEGNEVTWGPHPLPYRAPNGMRTKGYIEPDDYQTLLDQSNLRPVYDEDRMDPLDEDLFRDIDHQVYYDMESDQVVRKFIYEKVPGFRENLERKMNYKARLRGKVAEPDLSAQLLAEYQETEKQARKFLDMPGPDRENASPDEWPALEAGLGQDGEHLERVAQNILQTADNLRTALMSIRKLRKEGIEKIRNAITDDDAFSMYESVFPEHNTDAVNVL